ncbi:MAG: hypothetical protein AB7I41_03115 [Candidatus Sericytochromatia bacterium]
MKVESTGVVMIGLCDVQTSKCTAKTAPNPITAVWEEPNGMQTNVCRNCIDEMLRTEEWEMENVRPPFYLDIATTINNTLLMAIEVKKAPLFLKNQLKKAIEIKDKLLSKKQLPNQPFFMVIFVPGNAYLWYPDKLNQIKSEPDVEIESKNDLEKIINKIIDFDEDKYDDFEKAAYTWLTEKFSNNKRPDKWVLDLLNKYHTSSNEIRVTHQYKVS